MEYGQRVMVCCMIAIVILLWWHTMSSPDNSDSVQEERQDREDQLYAEERKLPADTKLRLITNPHYVQAGV